MRIKLLVSIMAAGTILSSCGSPAEIPDDDMAADTAFVFWSTAKVMYGYGLVVA